MMSMIRTLAFRILCSSVSLPRQIESVRRTAKTLVGKYPILVAQSIRKSWFKNKLIRRRTSCKGVASCVSWRAALLVARRGVALVDGSFET